MNELLASFSNILQIFALSNDLLLSDACASVVPSLIFQHYPNLQVTIVFCDMLTQYRFFQVKILHCINMPTFSTFSASACFIYLHRISVTKRYLINKAKLFFVQNFLFRLKKDIRPNTAGFIATPTPTCCETRLQAQ